MTLVYSALHSSHILFYFDWIGDVREGVPQVIHKHNIIKHLMLDKLKQPSNTLVVWNKKPFANHETI